MRYVEARIEDNNREEIYRIFVTRSLQLGPQNMYITQNYEDMLKKPIKEESAEDIVRDVMKDCGLSFGGE